MTTNSAGLTRAQFAMTAASVAVAVLPHLWRLPTLFALLIVVLLAGRAAQRHFGSARIPLAVKLPLILLVPVLVVAHYGNVFGREPGSALACTMLALKLIETETRRDARAAIAFSCFVLMSALLFDGGMGFTLLLCAALALFLATLHQLELVPLRPDQARQRWPRAAEGLRTSALALVAAIPLTTCAFLFLPRLGSPLWGTPTDGTIGHSGLGETMDPTNIQELLIDDSPAFRVGFEGALPARGQLYWRGPVLTQFDGRIWSRPQVAELRRRDVVQNVGSAVSYEVTLEPSDRRWLLALDVPLGAPDNALRAADLSLVASRPVDQLQRYTLTSALSYTLDAQIGEHERARNLALPAGFDPRARAQAKQWRDELGDDDAIIRAALDLFHRDFFYSLSAPELGRDSVDDFLFGTRKGFCQHFASSFTFLMRAAGIPARVVTGYQGGYYNAIGNYLVVRQSDAHAWSEVWLGARGWVRVDPTAAVSPQRVDFGARAAAGASAAWYQANWLLALRNELDLVNRGWNSLIVQFNVLRQQSVLMPLGIAKAEYYDLIWMLVGTSVLLLALYSWWVLRQPAEPGDSLDVAYASLCRKLARGGVERVPAEGPSTFASRVRRTIPMLPSLQELIERYAGLRYAHAIPATADVRAFAADVRALRVPRTFAIINAADGRIAS